MQCTFKLIFQQYVPRLKKENLVVALDILSCFEQLLYLKIIRLYYYYLQYFVCRNVNGINCSLPSYDCLR